MEITRKKCLRCNKTKHITEYYQQKRWYDSYCKKCRILYSKEWRKKNPEKRRLIKRRENRKYRKKKYRRLKEAAFIAYGGYICVVCKEKRKNCLTIDHIDNNGAMHRKDIGKGSSMLYKWLHKNNYPNGFQVLCRNCNWIKYLKYKNWFI